MAANGGTNTGDAIEDDEEKYNYYHCKCAYQLFEFEKKKKKSSFIVGRRFYYARKLTSAAAAAAVALFHVFCTISPELVWNII